MVGHPKRPIMIKKVLDKDNPDVLLLDYPTREELQSYLDQFYKDYEKILIQNDENFTDRGKFIIAVYNDPRGTGKFGLIREKL